MRAMNPIDINYNQRCDISVEGRSFPPMVLQVSGYSAAELNADNGLLCARLVASALQRRGVSPYDPLAHGVARDVKLYGQSGRPR